MSRTDSYSAMYAALSDMREAFHQYGRIDDSNAKLDEVAKLFATYLAYRRGRIDRFPAASETDLVEKLQEAFGEAASLPEYTTNEGHSIFGTTPALVLRASDALLAKDLHQVVTSAVDTAFATRSEAETFDVLNEAFGHFIRDNFRSNIEDAQYMTPPEVVSFCVKLAVEELMTDWALGGMPGSIKVMDPTCGVGSFLAAFYDEVRKVRALSHLKLDLIAQDKVERMLRLTAINMALFSVADHSATLGNSLALGSPLDQHNGTVDLIITNPPFGARFSQAEVKTRFGDNTPFFSSPSVSASTIDSELLFVDRALSLLKPGGRLFIVIPDGVVSAKGQPAALRKSIERRATLRAVIELPAVTFAQAGTRTRTVVLYLQRLGEGVSKVPTVFMATANDLGFQVSSRKGVQIKQSVGKDELAEILEAFRAFDEQAVTERPQILREEPSICAVPAEVVVREGWTPGHYGAKRLSAVRSMSTHNDIYPTPLSEVANLLTAERRTERYSAGIPYLSILHVIGEGIIDLKALANYAPKTPGIPLFPGEVVFSRLNPHITRLAVIPNIAPKLLCSNEFEVMTPKGVLNAYELAYLLNTQAVFSQVTNLTSGTSSSHSRVRSQDFGKIYLPVPRPGSERFELFRRLAERYRLAIEGLSKSLIEVDATRKQESDLLGA
jgi:type I restriction-modification system DNA methylase subunit